MRRWTFAFGVAVVLALAFSAVVEQGNTAPQRIQRRLSALRCSYEVSPGSVSHTAGAQTGTVAVTAPDGCEWTAASNEPWVAVTGGASGSGDGTVSYLVYANDSGVARVGSMTIAGQAVTVTQAAATCIFSIDPTSRSHGAATGTGTVAVTAAAGCEWAATSNDAWITITGGVSGSGAGTVTYGVTANTTPPRSGTVTVAGQPFTVTQAAEEITIYLGPYNNVPLVLVRIPAGAFTMGSPTTERGRASDERQHQVTLTQDFYLGRTEVTHAQWQAVMGFNAAGGHGAGPEHPVYNISWEQIAGIGGFIDTLNRALGTTKFRLPTEAEWEHAARGGTTTEFSFPAAADWDTACRSSAEADTHMWWCANSAATTQPVGTKLANPWGLFDMHGNVVEWVQDRYGSYPSGAQTDPAGPATGTKRVLRSGSFHIYARGCRSAQRYSNDGPAETYGFRLAMSP
jgi:formylglycine-generating enzyme required for sulfatase activity